MLKIFAVAILVLGLLGMGYYFLPSQITSPAGKHEFMIAIADGKMESPGKYTVNRGDSVTFKIRSDIAEEFHVHGYDRSVNLVPGTEATLTFTADASGRFEFELEHSKTELGSLEVMP